MLSITDCAFSWPISGETLDGARVGEGEGQGGKGYGGKGYGGDGRW